MPGTAVITVNSTAKIGKMPDLPKLTLGRKNNQGSNTCIVYIEIMINILVKNKSCRVTKRNVGV